MFRGAYSLILILSVLGVDQSLAATCDPTTISLNQTVNGTLTSSDCRVSDLLSGSDSSKSDLYELVLTSTASVTISLSSSEFDPFLRLLTENLSTIEEDDDSGTGFNAELTRELTSGTYRILVNSATSSEELGAYSLSITADNVAPSRLINISTRAFVETGDGVTIGGLIIEGTSPKTVYIRAIGPDLANRGVDGVLLDPQLQLFRGSDLIDSNDDWDQHTRSNEIPSSLIPNFQLESVIVATLEPGAYTAIVRGNAESTGIGLVEIFEAAADSSKLTNISTRGFVGSGDNVMIGGLVISGEQPKTVLVRAKGPSLADFGVPGVLNDPLLQLFSGQNLLDSNDSWQTHSNSAQIPTNLRLTNDNEAAILVTLNPGAYTAIVSGAGGTTGIGLVEVFEVQ